MSASTTLTVTPGATKSFSKKAGGSWGSGGRNLASGMKDLKYERKNSAFGLPGKRRPFEGSKNGGIFIRFRQPGIISSIPGE